MPCKAMHCTALHCNTINTIQCKQTNDNDHCRQQKKANELNGIDQNIMVCNRMQGIWNEKKACKNKNRKRKSQIESARRTDTESTRNCGRSVSFHSIKMQQSNSTARKGKAEQSKAQHSEL